MRLYQNYIVVMPADQAIQVSNLLARLGTLLDFTLELPEGDSFMFRVEPREIREAHTALLDALQHNWLGANPAPSRVTRGGPPTSGRACRRRPGAWA